VGSASRDRLHRAAAANIDNGQSGTHLVRFVATRELIATA
jgi:hypothetical protein